MDYKKIGDNIRKYRKGKYTQAELAKKINRTESSIRKYEKGLVEIPNSVLEQIAFVLDISLTQLMDANDVVHLIKESQKDKYGQDLLEFHAFNDLLYCIGCELYFPEDENLPTEWHYHNNIITSIPESEYDIFKNEIFNYSKYKLEELIKKYQPK